MRKKRRYYPKQQNTTYHGKEDFIVRTVVKKIEFINKPIGNNDRLKTVFYCPSSTAQKDRMCILYDYTTIKEGDDIEMTGFITNETFIARSVIIHKHEDKAVNDS